jgi:ankyrin repeat protein
LKQNGESNRTSLQILLKDRFQRVFRPNLILDLFENNDEAKRSYVQEVDKNGMSALHYAAKNFQLENLIELKDVFKEKEKEWNNFLFQKVSFNQNNILHVILDKCSGFEKKVYEFVKQAVDTEFLTKSDIKKLMQEKNRRNETPMYHTRGKVIELLLDSFEDMDEKIKYIMDSPADGTYLYFAVQRNNIEAVQSLLKAFDDHKQEELYKYLTERRGNNGLTAYELSLQQHDTGTQTELLKVAEAILYS